MPFTDLINNLNARCRQSLKGFHSGAPFVAAQGRVFIHHAGLCLESRFLPFIETSTGKVLGHAADLIATSLDTRRQLDADTVFERIDDAEELVCLDRLVRTLHALNYLTRGAGGNLLLKVHPQSLAHGKDGQCFACEEILRPCGLLPEKVTLEVDTQGFEGASGLTGAVAGFHTHGFDTAVSRFGCNSVDFDLLQDIRPRIVKLDPMLLASGRPLHRLIDRLHDFKVQVMAEDRDIGMLRDGTDRAHIDLLQARRGAANGASAVHAVQRRSC